MSPRASAEPHGRRAARRSWWAAGAITLALALALAPSAMGTDIAVSLSTSGPASEGLAQVDIGLRTAEALPSSDPDVPALPSLYVAIITASQTCAPTPANQAIRSAPPAYALFPSSYPGWVTGGVFQDPGDPINAGPIDASYTASIGPGSWRVCAWAQNGLDPAPAATGASPVFGIGLRARNLIVPSGGAPVASPTTLSNRWDLGGVFDKVDSLVARPRVISVSAVAGIVRIRWSTWGTSIARGSGTFLYRSYASGHGRTIPLRSRVIATRSVQCGVGLRVYTRLSVTVAGKLPKGAGPSRNFIWDQPGTRTRCAQLSR